MRKILRKIENLLFILLIGKKENDVMIKDCRRIVRNTFFSGFNEKTTKDLLVLWKRDVDGIIRLNRKLPPFHKGRMRGKYVEYCKSKFLYISFIKDGVQFGETIEY